MEQTNVMKKKQDFLKLNIMNEKNDGNFKQLWHVCWKNYSERYIFLKSRY